MAITSTKIIEKTLNSAFVKLVEDISKYGISINNRKGLRNQSFTVVNPCSNQIFGNCGEDPLYMFESFKFNYQKELFKGYFEGDTIINKVYQDDVYTTEQLLLCDDRAYFFRVSIFIDDKIHLLCNFGKMNIKHIQLAFFHCSILLALLSKHTGFKIGEITFNSSYFFFDKFDIEYERIYANDTFELSIIELENFYKIDLKTVTSYENYSLNPFLEGVLHLYNLRHLEREKCYITLNNYFKHVKMFEMWRIYDSKNNKHINS